MKWTALLTLGTFFTISGCEKLPELPLGGKDEAANIDASDAKSQKNEAPAAQPPVFTPEQTIAAFRSKKTTQLTETDILKLAALESGLDQIQELDLKGSRLGPASMTALARFTGLKKLNLEAASFGGGSLQSISKLPSLEWLDLSRTATNNSELSHVAMISALKVLRLGQTVINDDGLRLFTKLSVLEELDISGTETVGLGLAALGTDGAKAPLKILKASHSKVGTQGFRFVHQFPLEELYVSKAMVTDGSLTGLRGCDQLRILDLSHNQITDDAAKWLVSSRVLENVDLSGNSGISDGTLRRLQTVSTLSNLDLTQTSSSARAIQGLKQRLPNCTVQIDGQTL